MNLTSNEKKLIKHVLKMHLDEVRENMKLPSQEILMLAAEAKYEDFVEDLIKKI